ncbi:MAG: Mandelate racemase [Caulobacteraceae bacterium]|nr:Mandelate racemase [Caulobacteraceae bacterium]
MKITRVEVVTTLVPIVFGRHESRMPVVLVKIFTDAGIEGIGHTFSANPEFQRSLSSMVRELADLIVGEDPRRIEHLASKMLYPGNWVGPGGLLNIAASAIDIALWDIIGKDCGQPLWRLLGGFSDRVRTYQSGMPLGGTPDVLQRQASELVAQGHRAIKMRPNHERHARVAEVAERVRAVREAIGYDIDLMYDVNQAWTPSRAIRVGRALEEFELFWLEDPTLMHDVEGQAAVAEALDVPVCSGEYHYNMVSLLPLLKSRAVDYLMVDLCRMAGVTQFRKVAAMAEAFGIPVASHLVPEVFAHCIAAVPNGLIVEWMNWTAILFDGLPVLEDGALLLSERPGHGLTLLEGEVQKHRVD